MNLSSNMISIVSVLCAATALAQGLTYTSDPLVVGAGVHEEERHVERAVRNEVAIQLLENASYTGYNIIVNGSMTGILANGSTTVKLDASEGTWNRIRAFEHGIYLADMMKESLIGNTRVEMCDGPSFDSANVCGIYVNGPQSGTRLSNVIVDMTGVNSASGQTLGAIFAQSRASIYNTPGDGEVAIKFEDSRGLQVALQSLGGSINLHDTHISMRQGVSIMTQADGSVYLTRSSIEADPGNKLVVGGGSANNVVTLDHVDLSKALDQQICGTVGQVTVNLINGTTFDGYAVSDYYDSLVNDWTGEGSIILNIDSGASWNVTRYSDLGLSGSLSLSGDSTIYFHADGAGDFMNINSASVMLAEGSLLQLDMDSTAFSAGDIITLFTGTDSFTNDGAILASADGYSLLYNDLGNGQFELTGQMIKLIPEAATATLGLLGLLSLASRRRRD